MKKDRVNLFAEMPVNKLTRSLRRSPPIAMGGLGGVTSFSVCVTSFSVYSLRSVVCERFQEIAQPTPAACLFGR